MSSPHVVPYALAKLLEKTRNILCPSLFLLRKVTRLEPGADLASNTDEMIGDITSTALAAPIAIQHRILTLPNGVAVPMASALLMVWKPEVHNVIDVRAVASHVACGEIDDPATNSYPPYLSYLSVCKAISERCGRDLRTVDRALYGANCAENIG
jgi:hypothetical protein